MLPVRSVLFCVAGPQPVGLVWVGVDVLGLSEVPSGKKLQLLAAAKVQDNEEKKLDDNLKNVNLEPFAKLFVLPRTI